jgi:hypothetical protein
VIVPVGDVEGLAVGVARVVSDPGEFARRREAGQRQAGERTWGAVAKRQLDLYHAVLEGRGVRHALPRSPSARRAAARAEFGPTAATTGGVRPFAVPFLRRGGAVADALANVIDAMAELTSRA